MSAPTDSPTWAATGFATSPDPATRALGFLPGQRPPTQTVNYLLGLVASWIVYLAALAGRWRWVPAGSGKPVLVGAASLDAGGNGGLDFTGPGDSVNFPLEFLNVGDQITSYGLTVQVNSSAVNMQISLVRLDGHGGSTILDSQAVNPLGSTSFQKITFGFVTTIIVADGCSHHLQVTFGNAFTAGKIQTFGVLTVPTV